MPIEDIDKAAAQQSLADAREDIFSADSDAARKSAETAVAVAEAKIQAVDSPAYS